ncbi:MAG: prepilin-type N-terminal cleavage/methylation domain-containing protein [Candidatus Omnitrophota bacterium]
MRIRRPGFTLIEMLIAIVTLGVLAGLAIHAVTYHIERAHSASAIEVLTKAHAGYQRLLIENQQSVLAGKSWIWYIVGMNDPNVNPNPKFIYAFVPSPSAPVWLNASRISPPSIYTPPLWLSINLSSGNISKTFPY